MPKRLHRRLSASVCTATIGALLATGCAQSAPAGGSASSDPCNVGVGAVVGGMAGALLGGRGDKNRLVGAAIGAGVGALACVAYNYHARQVRSADQVAQAYTAQGGKPQPDAPLVTSYRTDARPTANPGEDIIVTSSIEVVPGRTQPLRDLREEFAVIDPQGVERSRLTKNPAPGSTGGAYVSTLQFTFPNSIPGGLYQVQSHLFVNGQPAGDSTVRIQVARAGSGRSLARLD